MTVSKNENGIYEAVIKTDDGDKTFSFQKWGAEDATDTLLDIIAVVGESMGGLLSVLSGSGADVDVGSASLEGLFRQLTLGLTRDKELSKRVLKKLSGDRVQCNGVNIDWKTFYKEQLPLTFPVAKAQLEVQYGNFFDAAKSFGLVGPSKTAAQ
ncbi:MAG: hypothetical protein EOO38_27485 [Cytophagaceae bacterium]|nr:MAG: hypothetical protein EOO38_27485 [Cytophagaceae bacterium]